MGHISEAWTNLALSRRELHHKLSGGNCTATGPFLRPTMLRAQLPNSTDAQRLNGTARLHRDCLRATSFEAAMSCLWRSAVGRPEARHGIGDHDAGYIGGWALSGLMALATILLLWHFQI